jgi:ABC-type lipoprotein release transport system permease subunit
MTFSRLLRRNLTFHRRANLALLLGVAVGTAVLTGALLVGDSLRGSLRDRALERLWWVDKAMVSSRFVRQDLAAQVGEYKPNQSGWRIYQPGTGMIEPGIILRGTVEVATENDTPGRQTRDVTVLAMRHDWRYMLVQTAGTPLFARKASFWRLFPPYRPRPDLTTAPVTVDWNARPDEAYVAAPLARALGLSETVKGHLVLRVPKASAIPRESALGRRDAESASEAIELTVGHILPDEHPASEFALAPGLSQPLNLYISLAMLQEKLGQPSRVNALLAFDSSTVLLGQLLREHLTLDDWGLLLHTPQSRADELVRRYDQNGDRKLQPDEWRRRIPEVVAMATPHPTPDAPLTRDDLLDYYRRRGVVTLESRQLMIEPAVERAAFDVAKTLGVKAMPTLVYLANSISDGKESIPYSVIGAVEPNDPVVALASGSDLRDDEILLVKWPESPLTAKPGDEITLTYFDPNQEGQIQEKTAEFRLKGFVPLEGAAADPDLSPEFPGITDKLGLRNWDPPFPYDPKRISKRDEDYWTKYRAAPKAYVTLATGRKLFGSRFGELTSIRLAPANGKDLEEASKDFGQRLLKTLRPEQGGFVFDDVRDRALRASSGGMGFAQLFPLFSLFLIAAALILVGLLVRLGLDRRATEIGLLLATGFRTRTVRRLLLVEGMFVAAFGGLLGLAGAIGYAGLMLRLLTALWPEGSVGSFLTLHVSGTSLAIGYVAALVVSGLTIWWAVRALNKVAPSTLLAGVTRADDTLTESKPRRWRRWLVIVGAAAGIGLIIGGLYVHGVEERAGSFFSGGMLLLVAALAAVGGWLRRPVRGFVHPGAPAALARLGVRNAARNATRSLLTAALIASAAFLLVAVESFRRSPEADFGAKSGGSGGFALTAETDLPLYRDPNSPEGRQDLLDALEKVYQRDPATKQKKLMDAQLLLEITPIIPLRLRAGDDTSCLNLYQPGRPRILGVPQSLIDRGGFHFAGTEGRSPEDRANPWRLLDQPTSDGAIPVFGEEHSVQWMLKSDLGGAIELPDGQGVSRKLRVVGLLQDSVFQSELLMSDANFLQLYPRQEGFSVFLLDPPAGRCHDVTSLFQTALDDHGITITPARERLAAYLAVENTYLSTFQVLGGFGLLLGALGLAVVLLRNVWERRGELALLRALGYRHRALGWLVFAENAALLLLGLAAGVGSAAAAVAPHVLTGEGAVPWGRLGLLLGLVLAVGFAAGGSAVRSTVRAPLVPALRKE